MPIAKLFYQSIVWKGSFFLSAFLLNILIARHFQASVSGEIYFLINVYSFIILIAGLAMESAISFYIATNEISITKLINFSLGWTAMIGAAIFIFLFTKHHNQFSSYDFLAIAFVCGNVLTNYCAGIAYAKKNFSLPNILNIIINFSLIFLLVLIDFFKIEFISDDVFFVIFFSSFLLQGLATFTSLIILYAQQWQLVFPTIIELKKIFRFSFIAFSANIIFFLLYRIDYWFVKEYCTSADLGNYIQVSKIAQVFFILPGILASAVFPLTAGGQRKQVNDILAIVSRSIFVLYFFCCAILAVVGKWLFPFLFGASFAKMYVPFLFLIPGILALSTLYTLTAYYAGKNRISVNIKGALISLIFVVIADLFLIPRYGINVAAINSSIAYIIYHIFVLNVFTKEYGMAASLFFNFKHSDFLKIKNSIFNKVSNEQ